MKSFILKIGRTKGLLLIAWLFSFVLFIAPKATTAQTFNIEDPVEGYTSDPADDIIVDQDAIQLRIIDVADFTLNDKFYFYYVETFEGAGDLTEERIVQTRTYPSGGWPNPDGRTFAGIISEMGTYDFYIAHWSGRFDHEYILAGDPDIDLTNTYGTSNTDFNFYFGNPGNRILSTNTFNLTGETEGDVLLAVDFNFLPIDSYPIVVEYSVNGTTWTRLKDNSVDENEEFSSHLAIYNPVFELPAAAISANSKFRLRQLNSVSLGSGINTWRSTGITIFKGDALNNEISSYVGRYNIIADPGDPPTPDPAISITAISDADGFPVNAGNRAIPTEVITLTAATANITLADYEYFVKFDGEILPADHIIDIRQDQGINSVEIDMKIPVDVPHLYNATTNISILVVDGTEIDYGAGALIDFYAIANYETELDDPDTELLIGGTRTDNTIEFNGDGVRQVTFPEMEINTTDGSNITFTITRITDPIPPTGNEIVFEYTVNGTDWTQLGTDIALGGPDGVGLGGETFTFENDDLIGIVSSTTQFRFRQKNATNGADIHTWSVENFILNVPGTNDNILVESANASGIIGIPSFTLALENSDLDPLFPGSTVSVLVENIEGAFPDYTIFEVYFGTSNKWVKTLNELQDFSFNLPLDNGYKTLYVRADVKDKTVQNFINFTIQPVNIAISDINFDYEDGGVQYNIPGNNLTVDFTMTGKVMNEAASVILQVKNEDDEWETIGIELMTTDMNSNSGGSISAVLPKYNYGANTDIRIFIENYPWVDEPVGYKSTYLNRNNGSSYPPNTYYYSIGTVIAENLLPESKIGFTLYLEGEEEGTAVMSYWTGSSFVQLGEKEFEITPDMNGHVSHIANFADYATPTELIGRTGNNYPAINFPNLTSSDLKVRGIRIMEPEIVQVSAVEATINVIYPSVSIEQLEAGYNFGEEISIQYSTFGILPEANAMVALTLEQNSIYYVLNESNLLGEQSLTVTIPTGEMLTDLGFDIESNFAIRARVYVPGTTAELLISQIEQTLSLSSDDFLEVVGWGSGPNIFNGTEERYAITKALDLQNIPEPVWLSFTYAGNVTYISEETLPYLQVSIDGGESYTTLKVEESVYSDINRLPATGSHNFVVPIDPMYLTSATHFRWIQDVVVSGTWAILNIKVLSGNSNLADFYINYIPTSYTVELTEYTEPNPYADYDNLDAYDLNLVDYDPETGLEPVIQVGQLTNLSWDIILDEEDEPVDVVWPAGTEFVFTINANDPETGEPYEFATKIDNGAFAVTLPDFITTGFYKLYVRAWIYEGEEVVFGYPGWVNDDPEQGLENAHEILSNILVVNNVTTPNHLEINLYGIAANNTDTEDTNLYFGGQMDVNYETFGLYEANARFQVVIEGDDMNGDMIYYNIVNDNTIGENMITINIPNQDELMVAGFDLDEDVYVKVYAYCPENETDEFVYSQVVLHNLSTIPGDFLEVNRGAGLNNSLTFNQTQEIDGIYTKRYAITKSLDKYVGNNATLDFHKLVFDYAQGTAIAPLTIQTLPVFQISIDAGETYTTIENLFEDNNYELDLTQEMLDNAANVHFRWIQVYPAGSWSLSNIKFVSGQSNWCAPYVDSNAVLADLIPVPTIYPDNFTNYEMIVADGEDEFELEDPVYVNTDTEFNWNIIDLTDTDNTWTTGTQFVFTMKDSNNDEYELQVQENSGSFTTQIPAELFETGTYTIYVRAQVVEDEENVYYYPTMDPLAPAVAVKTILVINQVQTDIRRLSVDLLDELTTAAFDIEEEVTITFTQYGEWEAGTMFAAALEQMDDNDNFLERVVLEQLSATDGSITVKMPTYVVKHNDFEYFNLKLYAYTGTEINFGATMEVEFETTQGDEADELEFDREGDRFAISTVMDLSRLSTAFLAFDYTANNILENPNTLPRLMVSTNGQDYEPLVIDSEFGAEGYLHANGFYTMSVEIPSEFLTSSTQFMFVQNVNRGVNQDTWVIQAVEVYSGDDNRLANYQEENNPQEVIFNLPDIANYEWEIVRDENGYEPVLYSGANVQFSWNMILDEETLLPIGTLYPEGTEYMFYLQDYPENGDVFALETTNEVEGIYEFTLPEDITRDSYPVLINVSLDNFIYVNIEDEVQVGSISVFNPLLVTQYTQEEVLYAGNSTDFTGMIENNVTTLNPDWYYNLVLTDQYGDDWLLDAKQGSATFANIAIPTYIQGGVNVEIQASIGDMMGIIGEQTISTADELLNSNNDFIESVFGFPYSLMGSEGSLILLTTIAQDLTNIQYAKFDVEVSKLELTDNQKMVFEYSVDGGVNYTTLHTYPDERFTEDDINSWFNEEYELPVEARTEETMLRWRIEEYKSQFRLQNIALEYMATEYEKAPMVYEAANITVAKQRIDITEATYTIGCDGGIVELTYEVRGKFGANNIVTIEESDNNEILEVDGEDLTFEGITEGTGSVVLNLGTIDNAPSGDDIHFRMIAEDLTNDTDDNYHVDITGNWNVYGVDIEIIPEISSNTIVEPKTGLDVTCADVERIVVIKNVQNNFKYQLKNHHTGALIGDAVIIDINNEDLMDNATFPFYNGTNLEINIGTITDEIAVEVMITAQDALGQLECNTIVPNSQAQFDIRPIYTLHYRWDSGAEFEPATEGQEFTICEGFTDLQFRMGYWRNGTFVSGSASWYRDDATMPMGNFTTLNNITISGTYYAIYNDGDCGEYSSATVDINVNAKPDQPSITVSGNGTACEGETITLTATAGFDYYRWYRNGTNPGNIVGGNTATYTAGASGTYRVEVSNVPFSQGCTSNKSNPVYIDIFEFNNVSFSTTSITLCSEGPGVAEITLINVQEDVNYALIDEATGNTFGSAISGDGSTNLTFNTDAIAGTKVFSILATNNQNNSCTKMVNTNLLTVTLDRPVKAVSYIDGAYAEIVQGSEYSTCANEVQLNIVKTNIDQPLNLMNGERVIWYKDGIVFQQFTGSNSYITATIYPTESGVYYAKYINNNAQEDNCYLITESINLTIGEKPARPVLTATGALEFCSGEGNLKLTAPAGFDSYIWYRNGTEMNDVLSTNNELNVVLSGDYRVKVLSALECESDW